MNKYIYIYIARFTVNIHIIDANNRLGKVEERFKQTNPFDRTSSKISFFAVGDSFGNVSLFKQVQSSVQGTLSTPLFRHVNSEISYSIESLNFEPSGRLLMASTSKNFILLFHLENLSKLKYLRKVSFKQFFSQNLAAKTDTQMLGTLKYKRLKAEPQILKKIPESPAAPPLKNLNKPVYFRKSEGNPNNNAGNINTTTKPFVGTHMAASMPLQQKVSKVTFGDAIQTNQKVHKISFTRKPKTSAQPLATSNMAPKITPVKSQELRFFEKAGVPDKKRVAKVDLEQRNSMEYLRNRK